VDEARAEARSVLGEAETERSSVLEAARAEGHEQGYRVGYTEGLTEAQSYVEKAKAALCDAEAAYQAMLAEAEPRLLALSMTAAKRVASEALKTDPDVARDLIRRGISALRDENEFRVMVDPDILSIMEDGGSRLAAEFGGRSVELAPDPSVDAGAVVKTPHGFVDATVSSQIRCLAEALSEARKRSAGDAQ
jgi:flagellar assembly protein FliH